MIDVVTGGGGGGHHDVGPHSGQRNALGGPRCAAAGVAVAPRPPATIRQTRNEAAWSVRMMVTVTGSLTKTRWARERRRPPRTQTQ